MSGKKKKPVIFVILFFVICLSGCQSGKSEQGNIRYKEDDTELQEVGQVTTGAAVFSGVSISKEERENYAIYQGAYSFCVNRDDGGVYYVDLAGEKYLYYWKDGKKTLILDKWVSEICYQDGKIYCIYDKTGKTYNPNVTPSYTGVVCSVDVKTGEFTILSKIKADTLAVTKDGLYCMWTTKPGAKKEKRKFWFYSFADKNMKRIPLREDCGTNQVRYGRYAMVVNFEGLTVETYSYFGMVLKNMETGEKQPFFGQEEEPILGYILEDDYYYKLVKEDGSVEWHVMDMTNGEKKKMNLEKPERIAQFVKLGDLLYSVDGSSGHIVVYDPEKEEMKVTEIKNTFGNVHWDYIISVPKTDGTYLYTRTESGNMIVLQAEDDEISEVWSAAMERES